MQTKTPIKGSVEWAVETETYITRHRVDFIVIDKAIEILITHNRGGYLHNETGPAMQQFVNIIDPMAYAKRTIRSTSPAMIREPNGLLKYESWAINGMAHRTDGPAVTELLDGRKIETWIYHDAVHRLDGPAHLSTDKKNNVEKDWYVHGEKLNNFDWWPKTEEGILSYIKAKPFLAEKVIDVCRHNNWFSKKTLSALEAILIT